MLPIAEEAPTASDELPTATMRPFEVTAMSSKYSFRSPPLDSRAKTVRLPVAA